MRISSHQRQPSRTHCQPRRYRDGPGQSEAYPERSRSLKRKGPKPIFGTKQVAQPDDTASGRFCDTLTRGSTSPPLPMDVGRGHGLPKFETDVLTCPGGPAPGLV